jgi:hypothetical protein
MSNAGWLRHFVRPRPGDTWEIKIPNRPKKVKRIGKINRIWIRSKDGRGEFGNVRRIYIHWYRLPKGRYSGITLKGLLKYGRLIQSNADRMAKDEAQRKRVDAKWSNEKS